MRVSRQKVQKTLYRRRFMPPPNVMNREGQNLYINDKIV
jgi:hypothetical protein